MLGISHTELPVGIKIRADWSIHYISLDANETEVLLGPQDGLEENQKYVFTVTAVNNIGTITSYQDGDDECLCKYIGEYYAMMDDFLRYFI